MIKRKDQRIGVFIDAANMYHSAKNIFSARMNFKNLLEEAVSGRQLIRAIAYVITTKGGEEKPFLDALTNIGIELKSKELQEFAGGAKKGDWDVGLAVDAIRISAGLDAVVLVSGDGDFVPLVEYLQHHGKQVEVMAFRGSVNSTLIERADGFTDLAEDAGRFIIKHGRGRGDRSVIIRKGGEKETV